MQKSTSDGYDQLSKSTEERIRRVKAAAGSVSDNIKAAEARLAQFCFEPFTCKVGDNYEMSWGPKQKRISVGKVLLGDLPFEARRRFATTGNLSEFIQNALEFMEKRLGL